jgi:hypothetical protein
MSRLTIPVLLLAAACSRIEARAEAHGEATGLARRALEHPEIRWADARTEHFHLHVSPAVGLDRRGMERLGRQAEAARREVLEMLGEADGGTKELFFVESRGRMREIVGQPYGGMASREDGAVFFTITAKTRPPLRHELMHLYSLTLWGDVYQHREWLREGLATLAVGHCHGWSFHELAAAYQDSGQRVPMDRLVGHFREHDDVVTYLQSASLLRFVADRHGSAALRTLFQGGAEAAPRAVGMDAAALDAAWRREIARPEHRRRPVSFAAIRAEGCE